MTERVQVNTEASLATVQAALKPFGCECVRAGDGIAVTVFEARDAIEEVTDHLRDAGIEAFVEELTCPVCGEAILSDATVEGFDGPAHADCI